MSNVLSGDRSYDISIKRDDGSSFSITSEQIKTEELGDNASGTPVTAEPTSAASQAGKIREGASFEDDSSLLTARERAALKLGVLNLADTSATAAELGIELHKKGFKTKFLPHDTPGDWSEGIYYETGELLPAVSVQNVIGNDYVLKEVNASSTDTAMPADVVVVIGHK
jgi:hypothetical protein